MTFKVFGKFSLRAGDASGQRAYPQHPRGSEWQVLVSCCCIPITSQTALIVGLLGQIVCIINAKIALCPELYEFTGSLSVGAVSHEVTMSKKNLLSKYSAEI